MKNISLNKIHLQSFDSNFNTESELIEDFFNPAMEKLTKLSNGISLIENTDSQLFENIKIDPQGTLRLSHNLQAVPKYRIILRQTSGGLLLDGKWTDRYVDFKNTGSDEFRGNVLLVKG